MFTPKDVSTILSFTMSGSPFELEMKLRDAERSVVHKVNSLAFGCRSGNRWVDPDFGPNSSDPTGIKAIYRAGRQTRRGMPSASSISWLRPNYQKRPKLPSGTFVDDASLFNEGSCSGDVIQGQVGDCWFISALAMIANESGLLDTIFFCGGERSEFPDLMNSKWLDAGIWVVRFAYNNVFSYIIIDDQFPCNPRTKEILLFGRCEELSELWVPIAEKAYAKLFGSYDSLTGGLSQVALRDLTGLCPEAHDITSKNVAGALYGDKLLEYIQERSEWNSLLGASSENVGGSGEGKGAQGIITGHAYSLLGLLPIKTNEGLVNIVLLRNPWGSGEWTGTWGDKCPKKKRYIDLVKKSWFSRPNRRHRNIYSKKGEYLEIEDDEDMFDDVDNGVFLMDILDFQKYFTEIVCCIDFPDGWRGRRIAGQWDRPHSGGNSSLSTWRVNPAFKLTIPRDNTRVFVRLDQQDKRIQYGLEFADKIFAIAFRIVPGNFNFNSTTASPTKIVPNSNNVTQPTFAYSETVTLEMTMKKGDVYVVPSTYNPGELGRFNLCVYCDCEDFQLESSEIIGEEEHVVYEPAKPKINVDLGFDPVEYHQNMVKVKDILDKSGVDTSKFDELKKGLPSDSDSLDLGQLNDLLTGKGGKSSANVTPDMTNFLSGGSRKTKINTEDIKKYLDPEKFVPNRIHDDNDDSRIKWDERHEERRSRRHDKRMERFAQLGKRRSGGIYKKFYMGGKLQPNDFGRGGSGGRDDVQSGRGFGGRGDNDRGYGGSRFGGDNSTVVTHHSTITRGGGIPDSNTSGYQKSTRTITTTKNGVTTTTVITDDGHELNNGEIGTNSEFFGGFESLNGPPSIQNGGPDPNFTNNNSNVQQYRRYGIDPKSEQSSTRVVKRVVSNNSDPSGGYETVTTTVTNDDGSTTTTTSTKGSSGNSTGTTSKQVSSSSRQHIQMSSIDDEIERIKSRHRKF